MNKQTYLLAHAKASVVKTIFYFLSILANLEHLQCIMGRLIMGALGALWVVLKIKKTQNGSIENKKRIGI